MSNLNNTGSDFSVISARSSLEYSGSSESSSATTVIEERFELNENEILEVKRISSLLEAKLEKQDNLLYLGWIVIIITALGVAVSLIAIIVQVILSLSDSKNISSCSECFSAYTVR